MIFVATLQPIRCVVKCNEQATKLFAIYYNFMLALFIAYALSQSFATYHGDGTIVVFGGEESV